MKALAGILLLLLAGIILASCSKEVMAAPKPTYALEFTMNGKHYQFTQEEVKAEAFANCGLRLYEVTVYTKSLDYFKIDWTDDSTLQAGIFVMSEEPTNKVSHSATFWYSAPGNSYTAKNFTITISSYKGGYANGRMDGSITGTINNLKFKEL